MCNDAKLMVLQALDAIRRDDGAALESHIDNLRIQWLAALAAQDDEAREDLGRWIPLLYAEWRRIFGGRREVIV